MLCSVGRLCTCCLGSITAKLESPYLVVQGFPRTFTPADVKRTLESIGVTIGPGAVPVSKSQFTAVSFWSLISLCSQLKFMDNQFTVVSEPPVIRRQPQTPHHLTKSFHITFPTAPHATAALRVISSRSDLFTSLGFTPTRRGSKDSTDRDSRTGKNSLSGKGEVLEASKWWIEAWTDAYPKSHFKNPSSSNETRLSSSSSSSNTHQHQNNIHNRTLLRSDIYPILTSLQVGASSLHQELRGKQVLLRGLPGGLIKHENGHAMGKILDSFRVVDDDGILELPK